VEITNYSATAPAAAIPASAARRVITDAGENVIWEGREYLGHCTNNIAEYRALILGLKGASSHGYNNLEVYLDSELLAKQINGSYRIKNEKI